MTSDCSSDTVTSVEQTMTETVPQDTESAVAPVPLRRRLRRAFWHAFARLFSLVLLVLLAIAKLIGRRRRPISSQGCTILLTGRFDSANWIRNHLGPLAASKECSQVLMVSTNLVPDLPKVTAIYPPKWMVKALGATQARLLTFAWAALCRRPDCVGGFYLVANGIVAALVARLVGARSMYFCVGGPAEVLDGGCHSRDNITGRMETADAVVEARLLRIVGTFDTIITMGTKAVAFFREEGVHTAFHVVSGGIDPSKFQRATQPPEYDLILTGRLVEIKRIDVLLQAVKIAAERVPDIKAVLVGDGPLRGSLQALSADLHIDRHVSFVGRQDDVAAWLRRSRVFALTSDSEGLSLSMMEAMMCGLPAIVSDVGDLGDLVENGVNGYLVPRRSPALFADRIVELLSDERKLESFSDAAHDAAMRYETDATIRRWNQILAEVAQL
jgi:glycosyltransferase involved in cell wall biosynthesis